MNSRQLKSLLLSQIKQSNKSLPIVETLVSTSNIDKVIESENDKITPVTMWEEDGIIVEPEEE